MSSFNLPFFTVGVRHRNPELFKADVVLSRVFPARNLFHDLPLL